MFTVCSKSHVYCLRKQMLKSPWFCGSGCFGEKCACLQKMLSRGEIRTRCRSGILHHSRHSQFWGWRKVVPSCGVLNVSNPYSTGKPWSKKNSQGVHELDCFPHCVLAAAAIGEQMVDICTERSCSAKENVWWFSPITAV